MKLRDYFAVLRSRWALILGCVIVALAVAGVQSALAARLYQAQASVFVSVSVGRTSGDLTRAYSYAEGLVSSYAELATEPVVLTPVIQRLALPTTPRALARSIKADVPLDTTIIDIQVQDTSARRASDIANAIARQLSVAVDTLVPRVPIDAVGSRASPSPAATSTLPGGLTGRPTTEAVVRVSVVSEAPVPDAPSSPRVALDLTLGLLAGIAGGVLLAFFRDVVDARVHDRQDVARVTGVPVIGATSIPRATALRGSLLRRRNRRAEEQAKELRTNFQHLRVDRALRSVVFTSANDDVATAFTVKSLGQHLANVGVRTLIVDADLRRPVLSDSFGDDSSVGLSTVLLGETRWENVVQQRDRAWLHLLPAGPQLTDPSITLHQEALEYLLRELSGHYDVVLVKAPPVLRVADALLLSRVADGVVIVADGPGMKRRVLADEVHALGVADVDTLGIVLVA